MTRFDLNELLRNEVLAALDDRIESLTRTVHRLEVMTAQFESKGFSLSEDTGRAIVWTNDALLQSKMAREVIGEAEATPEPPADATYAGWTEGEMAR